MRNGILLSWFDQASFDRARREYGEWVSMLSNAETHDEYRQLLEEEMRVVNAVRVGELRMRGVAPVQIEELDEWLRSRGAESGDADAFEDFMDAQNDAGNVVEWPPGRNDPCWCGSATKYKRCCGALAISAQAIAERSAVLREAIEQMHSVDTEDDVTMDELLNVRDSMLTELRSVEPSERSDLIDELRFEAFGGAYFIVLMELAAASTARTVADADDDLRPLLDHELFTENPDVTGYVRFMYAEALSSNDRHEAALGMATAGLAQLVSAGVRPCASDRALECSFLAATRGSDAADAALHALHDDVDPDERLDVSNVAADTFEAANEFRRAAAWGARRLRIALDSDDPGYMTPEWCSTQLRRIISDDEDLLELHQALLDEAESLT